MEKYHILIAEDDVPIGEMVQTILSRNNLDSVIATNGQSALEHLSLYRPALVITDNDMPILSGIDLIKAASANHYNVPFLLMSGRRLPERMQIHMTTFGLAANAYLSKPFTVKELSDKVDELRLSDSAWKQLQLKTGTEY